MGLRVLLAAAFALAAALALSACGGPAQPGRDWPDPAPALWEVTGPGGERGWLFGTIHALPDGLEWRTPTLTQALAESGALVVEVAELGNRQAAAEELAKRARSPGLPPLLQRVAAQDRAALKAALDAAGIEEADFAGVESWAAALQLASALRRHDPANGVDRALIAEGKRVLGLETLGQQFALFDTLAPARQARLLVEVAREGGDVAAQEERAAAWLAGDLARLERDARQGMLADPALREQLQLARNRAWAARMDTLLATGERPFVAVGAAHMLGEEGLPALLAARGYTVRRIQ